MSLITKGTKKIGKVVSELTVFNSCSGNLDAYIYFGDKPPNCKYYGRIKWLKSDIKPILPISNDVNNIYFYKWKGEHLCITINNA